VNDWGEELGVEEEELGVEEEEPVPSFGLSSFVDVDVDSVAFPMPE
jgi:hypothetical protein